MKKVISLLLSITILLSLCSCGGSSEPTEEAESDLWSLTFPTDEFGDIKEGESPVLRVPIIGDFSNTATNGSELTGYVFIQETPGGGHYYVSFRLLEYGTHHATYTNTEADNLILKTKIEDTVSEYSLGGMAPNSDVFLSPDDGDVLFNALYEGKDIKCVIYIGYSQYNFTILNDGFLKTFETREEYIQTKADEEKKAAQEEAARLNEEAAKLSMEVAVQSIVCEDGETLPLAPLCITQRLNDYAIVNTEELNSLLSGEFLQILCAYNYKTGTTEYYWTILEYTPNTEASIGMFLSPQPRTYSIRNNSPESIMIDNNMIIQSGTSSITQYWKLLKITDDILVSTYREVDRDDSGSSSADFEFQGLLIKCPENYVSALTEGSSAEELVNYICNELLPEIE